MRPAPPKTNAIFAFLHLNRSGRLSFLIAFSCERQLHARENRHGPLLALMIFSLQGFAQNAFAEENLARIGRSSFVAPEGFQHTNLHVAIGGVRIEPSSPETWSENFPYERKK